MTISVQQTTSPERRQKMRRDADSIFTAGINAADPYKAVKRCLKRTNEHIEISLDSLNGNAIRRGAWRKVHLIAFGKAACAMAEAAQEIIPANTMANKGLVVTNYENVRCVANCQVIGANHPLPDQAGANAAKQVAEMARNAQKGELVLVLISGGGSALLPFPASGINLADKMAATKLLLASGATINEVNGVRKHLSQLKGGRLAELAAPADVHALILSDVPDNDLSAIASGPTVPDPSNFQQARAVFKNKGLWNKVPENVRQLLNQGCMGKIKETPKPGNALFRHSSHTLVGSNHISVQAIIANAEKHGYVPRLYSDHLCGEAREEAEKLVLYVQQMVNEKINKPTAVLAGGETTVTLTGNGCGGRNQEMSLAFTIAAKTHHLPACWVFLSAGTDGRDGPTNAAGAIVDPDSIYRMQRANIDAQQFLEDNNSYTALKISQDLLETGATGTNVADLQVLLILPLTMNAPYFGEKNVY